VKAGITQIKTDCP